MSRQVEVARFFRIVEKRHMATAWSGEGAAQFGGRWNSPGTGVVYAAASLSLAAWERLVHLEPGRPGPNFVWASIDVPMSQVHRVDAVKLPANWRNDPAPESAQQIGDRWFVAGQSIALRVPSVIFPTEDNILIHPDLLEEAGCTRSDFQPFDFDPRVKRRLR